MESLPVKVIGNILSRLGAARNILVASATCRKWRDAWKNHLHTLAFDSKDWISYNRVSGKRLNIIISQTIFQTSRRLESFTIIMDNELPAYSVILWLVHLRDNLRELQYNVRTTPRINILEKCNLQKLEVLTLGGGNSITWVAPVYQKFSYLRRVSLSYVSASALDLSRLLSACPNIEFLSLVRLDVVKHPGTGTRTTIFELKSKSLKDIYVEGMSVFDGFILKAHNMEKLHLKDCIFRFIKVVAKGTLLRFLKIDHVKVTEVDLGGAVTNLEVVDISFTSQIRKFHSMISRSSKLRRLRLWRFDVGAVNIKTIHAHFPLLTHLSLNYDHLTTGLITRTPQPDDDSMQLRNVVELELGWTVLCGLFKLWVTMFLERCPNLKKLVIYGVISYACVDVLADFTTSIMKLMRKYVHVQIEFEWNNLILSESDSLESDLSESNLSESDSLASV